MNVITHALVRSVTRKRCQNCGDSWPRRKLTQCTMRRRTRRFCPHCVDFFSTGKLRF